MGQKPTEIGNGDNDIVRGAGDAPGDDNPEAIRTDIEHTRAEMGETIDAIQEKINPDTLKEQAKEALREATVGRASETVENAVASAEEAAYAASDAAMEVGSSMMETIRGNPIPSLLAAAGLGWLYMNRQPARRSGHYYYRGEPEGYYRRGRGPERQGEYRYMGERPDSRQESSEGLGEMAERAGEMAGRAQERAGEFAGEARGMAEQAGSTVGDLVRENPIPSALVSLGLGWLLMNSGSSSRQRQHESDYPYYYSRHGRGAGPGPRERVGEVTDRAAEAVGGVVGQAQSTAGQVADQAQEAAGQVQETMSDLAYRTRRQAGRVEDQFQHLLWENPLAVGAAAVAVGALLGAAVPGTEREREMMGETRDNLMEQARGKAEEVAEKVQRVADDTGEEARRKAREEGLTQ
ncbi:MAG: DUF3618 domain-containing protein [Chloroflexota bacterium]